MSLVTKYLPLVYAVIGAWLVKHIPELDPEMAKKVAEFLANYGFELIAAAFAAGWKYFRRPGDVPRDSLPPTFIAADGKKVGP